MNYWKVLLSPFRPFRLRFHVGRVAVGTPYFYPRKWVKATPELARKATLEYIAREEEFNQRNPAVARKIRPYEEVYQERLRYQYTVPKKIGFDFVRLGWKTKWEPDDYRFEWAPVWSFVFFKWQIAVIVVAPHQDKYWECWLYYERDTDKSKTVAERIAQARSEFPCAWKVYKKDGQQETIDYWDLILKKKWL